MYIWRWYNIDWHKLKQLKYQCVYACFLNLKKLFIAERNGADLSSYYLCSFEGYQDTLYMHSMRQFYKDCDICGTVDFIFGNAAILSSKPATSILVFQCLARAIPSQLKVKRIPIRTLESRSTSATLCPLQTWLGITPLMFISEAMEGVFKD